MVLPRGRLHPGVGGVLARLRRAALDAVAPARCAGCDGLGSVLCEDCVSDILSVASPPVAGCSAAFEYRDRVRAVVHRGKFRDCRGALRTLAWAGAERLLPPPGAVVTPVPLAAARIRERGYNQAAVVARALADFHRLPMVELLRRTRDTPRQSTLDRVGRQANVAGAFVATAGAVGAAVWLIDDVRTTGATTASARRALLAGGATRVEVAVLAAVV